MLHVHRRFGRTHRLRYKHQLSVAGFLRDTQIQSKNARATDSNYYAQNDCGSHLSSFTQNVFCSSL
jgi:hypothetical protein